MPPVRLFAPVQIVGEPGSGEQVEAESVRDPLDLIERCGIPVQFLLSASRDPRWIHLPAVRILIEQAFIPVAMLARVWLRLPPLQAARFPPAPVLPFPDAPASFRPARFLDVDPFR